MASAHPSPLSARRGFLGSRPFSQVNDWLRGRGETVFTGYTDLETASTVLGILHDGVPVTRASAGQIVEVILAETALYAESGGQVADKGVIVEHAAPIAMAGICT